MKRGRGLRFTPKAARKWISGEGQQEYPRLLRWTYCNLDIGKPEPLIWRERQFQASVISYIDAKHRKVGPLAFHVPLELLRTEERTAPMFHKLGARAGVADLVMLVPRGAYHGFVMELKIPPRRPTDSQLQFLVAARLAGYAAAWTDSYHTALALIDSYLSLPARAKLSELEQPLGGSDESARPENRKASRHRTRAA